MNSRILPFLLVPALVVYFFFGFFHIGKFMTADEHLWIYERIPRYWNAIADQNWKKTFVHEKPGITLAIISGVAMLKYENPSAFFSKNRAAKTGENETLEKMLSAFRMPILFFNGFFSLFFFWILKKITGNPWLSLWSAILILLSPILLGSSQIVNSDSLLWSFAPATVLSFLAYLKSSEKKMIFLSSLLLGLSVLTKFSANILYPFLFLMVIFHLFHNFNKEKKGIGFFSEKIKKYFTNYFLVVLGSLAIFAFFMPASLWEPRKYWFEETIGYSSMPLFLFPLFAAGIFLIVEHYWTRHKFSIFILEKTIFFWKIYGRFSSGLLSLIFSFLIANYFFGSDFLNLEKIPFDARQGAIFKNLPLYTQTLLEFRPTVFTLTPLVIFFCLFIWIKMIFSKIQERFLVTVLSSFVLIYVGALLQQQLLDIVRYNLIIYPAFSIIAAVGIFELISQKSNWKFFYPAITFALVLVGFFSLWKIKPYYFNYTNLLLPKKFVVLDSWGYGGYEAAEKLNALPDAKNLSVWTDYYGFCDFFKGKCFSEFDNLMKKNQPVFDYLILTRRGEVKYSQKLRDKSFVRKYSSFSEFEKYYQKKAPLWELWIGERKNNFVKIIESK